jgi:ATP-binding cassette subfamily B protein/subfamily B ATP-binding cassette protein MsbA
MDLLSPWPLKIIFDYVLLAQPLPPALGWVNSAFGNQSNFLLLGLAASIAVIAFLQNCFSYWQTHLTSRIGFQLVTVLRHELFIQLQRLPLTFHAKAQRGELLTKVASDTQALKDAFVEAGLAIVTNTLTVIGMLTVMLVVNWRLSLIPLLTLPLISWVFIQQQTKIKVSLRNQRKREGRLAAQLSENLATLPVVRAFGREQHEVLRFDVANRHALAESIQLTRTSAAMTRTISTISATGVAMVVFYGAQLALAGQMTPGDVLLFVAYVRGMYKPLRDVIKQSTKVSKALVSAQRLGEILDVEPEPPDKPDAIVAGTLRGEIVFERVFFGYGDAPDVLCDVSFLIQAGQRVALVGASGAGKSTIANLILRLYEPAEGRIWIDGVAIQDYQRESLRRQIGLVLQDSILFGASIRENISYGKPEATQVEIEEAGRQAHIHDFILALPDGYDTVIGEMGSTLSGGQRQRIAIARALVKQPSILILDEPTAALDAESRTIVTEMIHRLHGGKTVLVITHQLTTIQDFDQILVLSQGRIVGRGKHEQLLNRCELYAQLYCQQEGKMALPAEPTTAFTVR